MHYKWIIYAVLASILWGGSDVLIGPFLHNKIDPLIFCFFYYLLGMLVVSGLLLLKGKNISHVFSLNEFEVSSLCWIFFGALFWCLGDVFNIFSIGAKNPILVGVIVISYPVFIILFTWLFYGKFELNLIKSLGVILILAGVFIVLIDKKNS
ncbi:MAG: DMT family transporter [Chthoniobacterales bacterium]|nr:DMT family transporter [Chthoniobacterales bacterium]